MHCTKPLFWLAALILAPHGAALTDSDNNTAEDPLAATFSIVGFDPETGDLGVAVQSKFFGVGSVVPWAKAKVGAIATQAWANVGYGPDGLVLLESGKSARETLEALVQGDDNRGRRQLGIVDAEGRGASFTGEECLDWAGHLEGEHFAIQGNILAGVEVVQQMREAYLQARKEEGSQLADWLMAALAAGQKAGGDKRGQQSASLLVVREKGGFGGATDRYIDLRVEDHAAPIEELARLLEIHKNFFRGAHRNKPKRQARLEPKPGADGEDKTEGISFVAEIAPIFVNKCLTCHNADRARGRYRLDTFASLIKPGSSGEDPIVPGRLDLSVLFQLLTSSAEEDRMPQKDDPLPPDQIALIKQWIEEGARFDGVEEGDLLARIIPRQSYPEPPSEYPHPVPVTALAFGPNGAELAVGGYHEITIWNPENGALLRRLQPLGQRVQSLEFSPDGTLIAAAHGTPGRGGEVTLLRADTGEQVKTLGTLSDMVLVVKFSPDGRRLAAGGTDNSIHIYEIENGRRELSIEQHSDWVLGLSWSHHGTLLASAGRDRSARVYHSQTGRLETTFTEHSGPVYDVAFSPDDKTVYSAGKDRRILFWSVDEGKRSGEIGGLKGEIFRLLFQGEHLFSCGSDREIRQHTVIDRNLARTFSGHEDWIYSLALHAGTGRIASGSFDGEVRVWSLEEGKLIGNFIAAPGLGSGLSR